MVETSVSVLNLSWNYLLRLWMDRNMLKDWSFKDDTYQLD